MAVTATTATTRLAAHVRDLLTARPWRNRAGAGAPATCVATRPVGCARMFASSGRAQLAFDSSGVDGGADVLLIHAGVNDRRSWQHVVERLAPRHRCVAYDTRGYGETTYEREDGWSPVADAVAVLDAAGLQRPIVVACSMGGQTAIDLALAHPDRVAGAAADRHRHPRRAVPRAHGGADGRAERADRGRRRRAATWTRSAGSTRGCGSTAPAHRRVASAAPRVSCSSR